MQELQHATQVEQLAQVVQCVMQVVQLVTRSSLGGMSELVHSVHHQSVLGTAQQGAAQSLSCQEWFQGRAEDSVAGR